MPIIVPTTGGFTFLDLQTEFYARGPDYLEDDAAGQTRAKVWLNSAYQDICERYPWPFLRVTVDDSAPVVFTDLREVTSVYDTTLSRPLWVLEDGESLTTLGYDLTMTGEPTHAYLEDDTLFTYPASTDDLRIRYVGVPADMVADTDRPVVPGRFQDAIIDGALVWAFKDNDAYGKAGSLSQMYEAAITQMAVSLMHRNNANPEVQRLYYGGNH